MQRAKELVDRSSGIARARALAATHAAEAAAALRRLPELHAAHAVLSRQALLQITERVLTRRK